MIHAFPSAGGSPRLALVLACAAMLAACGDSNTPPAHPAQVPAANGPAATAEAPRSVAAPVPQAAAPVPQADRNTPDEAYVALDSGQQLMFAYLALSGLPPDTAQIATRISREYAASSDEFQKRDLLKALAPRIDAQIAEARARRYFKITLDNALDRYSFEQGGFPLDHSLWESGAYRYFSDASNYKLGFSNGERFRYLAVAQEAVAREIESRRSREGGLKLVVYGFFQSTGVGDERVMAEIVKVRLQDRQGKVLATQ